MMKGKRSFPRYSPHHVIFETNNEVIYSRMSSCKCHLPYLFFYMISGMVWDSQSLCLKYIQKWLSICPREFRDIQLLPLVKSHRAVWASLPFAVWSLKFEKTSLQGHLSCFSSCVYPENFEHILVKITPAVLIYLASFPMCLPPPLHPLEFLNTE